MPVSEKSAPVQVSIIFPAYNEEQAIELVIDQVKNAMKGSTYTYEILVVDDGSTDRTAELARAAGARVVSHERNRGNGRARKTGVREAYGELIVMNDADGTYPTEPIPQMLDLLKTYDMVVGARIKEMGTMRILRSTAKYLILQLARFVSGERIDDLNSGLRAFHRDTTLKFIHMFPDTHSWVSTQTLSYLSNEYSVHYLPIDYYKRIGRSTFHPIRDTYNYVSLVIRATTYFEPYKVFVPLSGFIGGFGLVKLLFDWLWNSDIRESDIMIVLTGVILGSVAMLADLIVKNNRAHYLKGASKPKDE